MLKSIITIIFSVWLIVGCHHKELNKNSTSEKSPKNQSAAPEIKNAIVDPELDITSIGVPCTIDSLAINGDILSIFVNYSGGCKEHSFDLYSNSQYGKSLPPQLKLFLKHTGNDDACRELIIKELKFNVSNLKYPGKNTVVLKLADKKITYTSN